MLRSREAPPVYYFTHEDRSCTSGIERLLVSRYPFAASSNVAAIPVIPGAAFRPTVRANSKPRSDAR